MKRKESNMTTETVDKGFLHGCRKGKKEYLFIHRHTHTGGARQTIICAGSMRKAENQAAKKNGDFFRVEKAYRRIR